MHYGPLVLSLAVAAFSGTAHASDRAAELVGSFQNICIAGPLDFNQLDAKAASMGLKVHDDIRKPADAKGHYVHSKSWYMPSSSGQQELAAADGEEAKGHVSSCGVSALDIDGDDFRTELMKAEKLDGPGKEIVSGDGMRRISAWQYQGDESKQLMLVDGAPKHSPGVILMLVEISSPK